jgi:hypothetical protein
MSSEDIAQEARFRPLKVAAKTRLTQLMIRGKRSIFEACSLEDQLVKYVEAPKLLGLVVKDTDLQREACDIVRRAEQSWPSETGIFGNLLVRLICGSAGWLESFRQREGLESSLPVASIYQGVTASTVLNQMPQLEVSSNHVSMVSGCPATIQSSTTSPLHTPPDGVAGSSANTFSHDDNCYRKLTRDLSTFITRTMSKNNPNRHVPTDAEIQNQARWIMFDE